MTARSTRPTLRRVDLQDATTVRLADGTYPVLQVNETTVRVRKTWGWVDVPLGDVLGVSL